MTENRVTTEKRGHLWLMGLNRPEKLNAFDLRMLDELSAAYEVLGDAPELRVGILHAHGDHFSAGLDLADVWSTLSERGPGILAGPGRYDPLGVWTPAVPKPVMLAVQGIAYTISIELALAADVVVTAEDVRFRQLEVGRGILPFGGATFRAPAQLGWGNAVRFLLTAEEFGAQEAFRIGLVQEVVPTGEQLARAIQIGEAVAQQALLGVQETGSRGPRRNGRPPRTSTPSCRESSIAKTRRRDSRVSKSVDRRGLQETPPRRTQTATTPAPDRPRRHSRKEGSSPANQRPSASGQGADGSAQHENGRHQV